MEPGPYAPPKAPVVDAPTPARSPRTLLIVAVVLMCVVIAVDLGKMVRTYVISVHTAPIWYYLPSLVEVVVLAGCSIFAWKRQGWARWLVIVLVCWRFFAIVVYARTFSLMAAENGVSIAWWREAQFLIEPAMLTVAAALLFGPAREWFKKRE